MSSIKNEIITKDVSNNDEININQIKFQRNSIENGEGREQDLSKSNTNNEVNININSKTEQTLISKRKRKKQSKERIFRITKKKRHNCFSNDNNEKIIIKHFVNFFLNYINLVINEILRNNKINKKIDFKINHVIKSYISIDFITSKTVKDLLKFRLGDQNHTKQIKNTKQIDIHKKRHGKKYIMDIEKSIKENEKQIRKLKDIKNIDSQIKKLFETKILDIFKKYYVKNRVDLSSYGIDGTKLDMKNFQTYEMIRNKYKDSEKKLEIFDNLIENKFILKKFKTKRKK